MRGTIVFVFGLVLLDACAATVAAQTDPETLDPAQSEQMISGGPAEAEAAAAAEAAEEAAKAAEEAAAAAAEAEAKKAKYQWTLAAGGSLNTGNTESWGVLAGTNFNAKKTKHEFDAAWLFNYERANPGTGYADTVKNSNVQLRYNFWFTDSDAFYVGFLHRWDKFAGLDTRLRLDAGYLRKLWSTDTQTLKGEIGAVYIYDNRVAAVAPEVQHNASMRAMLGYENAFSETGKFHLNVEFLDNILSLDEMPADVDPFKDVRVNVDTGVTATLVEKLALGITFLLAYDAEPVPGAEKLDTTTLVSLIYTML